MAYLVPTIHPAAILHKGMPITDVIASDLYKALQISQRGPKLDETIIYATPGYPGGLDLAVDRASQWMEFWAKQGGQLGVDVETSGLEYFNCKLYSIALGDAEHHIALAFTLMDFHTLPDAMENRLIWHLRQVLASDKVTKVFHNAPFDRAVLDRKGFLVRGRILDTLSLHHLVQPDIPHDLGWLGQTYLECGPWKLDHQSGKMANTRDPLELLVYNAKDALYTCMCVPPLLDDLQKRGISNEVIHWQLAFSNLATQMELRGLPVNQMRRREMAIEKRAKLATLKRELREFLNWPDFNPMSDAHRRDVLFSQKYAGAPWNLGLNPTRLTAKTQKSSTGRRSLADHLEHPFVKKLTAYIETRHTYATQYKDGTLRASGDTEDDIGTKGELETPGAYQKAMCEDGRMHPKWNPHGTTGSRYTSSPNCYDAETEVLTNHGWTLFSKAAELHLPVMQFDQATRMANLALAKYMQRPLDEGERMISIKTRHIDLRVTELHRMLISHRTIRNGKHTFVETILPVFRLLKHYTQPGILQAANGCKHAELRVDERFITILLACLSRNWRSKSFTKGLFSFETSHRGMATRLLKALKYGDKDGLEHHCQVSRNGQSKQIYTIYITKPDLCKSIHDLLGDTFNELDITRILTWDTISLKALIAQTPYWLGGRDDAHRAIRHGTTRTLETIQIAEALTGSKVGIHNKKENALSIGAKGPWIRFNRRKHVKVAECDPSAPETVYCVSVPTGLIFVRRNGKVAICGNCQNQMVADREFFEAPPGRILVAADKDQLELRLMAVRAGVPELLEEMRKKGGDSHRVAAINVYGQEFLNRDPKEQKKLRDMVKNVVYASIFLAGVETVWRTIRENKFLDASMRAAMTLAVVRHIHSSYFMRYPEILKFHQGNMDLIAKQGYLEIPPFGRRRFYPVQPPPINEAANWPIQCYTEDMKIHSVGGLRRIINCDGAMVYLPSGHGTAYATLVPRGTANLLEISLDNGGHPYKVSEDHVWLCQTDDRYLYRHAHELKPGDKICTQMVGTEQPAASQRARDWPYWLGALTSDGSTSDYSYVLFFGTSKLRRDGKALAHAFAKFAWARGWVPRKPASEKQNLWKVKIGATDKGRQRFREDMTFWGYDRDAIARTKRVPSSVYEHGVWGARQYLWGMLEADGTQGSSLSRAGNHRHSIYNFHMCNRELLQDLLDLARYAGVSGSVRGPFSHRGHTSWRLELNAYDVESVFYAERLEQRQRSRIAHETLAPRRAIDEFLTTVPASTYRRRSTAATLHYRMRTGGSTSPETLRRLYMLADAPVPALYSHCRVTQIVPLEQPEKVYTLSVVHPEHQYCARGTATKNCLGSDIVTKEMVEIDDELQKRYHGQAFVILHGHDQIVIECPESIAEEVRDLTGQMFGNSIVDGPAGPVTLTAKPNIGKTLKAVK